jgi:hypothetical protein
MFCELIYVMVTAGHEKTKIRNGSITQPISKFERLTCSISEFKINDDVQNI